MTTTEIKPYRSFSEWLFQNGRRLKIDKKNSYRIMGFSYTQINSWQDAKSIPTTRSIFRIVKSVSKYTGLPKEEILMSIIESIPEWRNM